jgi:hypothetical protein
MEGIMSRRRSRKDRGLPPLLVRLIQAAEHSGEDAEGADISGAPDALRELGKLALWVLPIHGVFVPNNPDISFQIQRISIAHLGLDHARKEFREALKAVEPFAQRDAIESAHNQVRSVDDEAYFYSGLAFGITLANLGSST